jgi:dihydrofolate reductase
MTRIALVVAHTSNRVIGRDNAMPWHLPADLQHFRALTFGHPILMGRRTHLAIGRPLPGRRNLVLTRQTDLALPGVDCVSSITAAVARCGNAPWLFVIGGAEIYALTLPLAERLHVTEIGTELAGDAYFPPLDPAAWAETASNDRPADAANIWPLRFVTLERRAADAEGA